MGFYLDEQEAVTVRWALDNYLPTLRYETCRIKRERDRHELVQKEELLSALVEKLTVAENREQPAPSP